MRRSVRAVPQDNHVSNLGVITPPDWQSMTFEREGKLLEGGRNLAFMGLNFVPPECAAWILGAEEKTSTSQRRARVYYPF